MNSVAKTIFNKIETLIICIKFLSSEVAFYFFKVTIRPSLKHCFHVCAGVSRCLEEKYQISYIPLLNLWFNGYLLSLGAFNIAFFILFIFFLLFFLQLYAFQWLFILAWGEFQPKKSSQNKFEICKRGNLLLLKTPNREIGKTYFSVLRNC